MMETQERINIRTCDGWIKKYKKEDILSSKELLWCAKVIETSISEVFNVNSFRRYIQIFIYF